MSLEDLPLAPPPLFAEACGYVGHARFVALRWLPEVQELWWSDDGHATLGDAIPLIALCEHPVTAAALCDYVQASRNAQFGPWLVVDRARRTMQAGQPLQVWRVIEPQREEVSRRRRPAPDVMRQRELARSVLMWLDSMALRQPAE